MGLREWLPFRRKDNPVANVIVLGLWGANQLIQPKNNLARQALEGYQQNTTVFDCVNLISRNCAGVPWVLMQRGATATSKPRKLMTFRTAAKAMRTGHPIKQRSVRTSEVEDHPLLRLIERPNPTQGGPEYTENVFGFFLISGNSFETWVSPDTGPNRGRPMELWTMRPDRMKVIAADGHTGLAIGSYQYWVGGAIQPFGIEQVLHQKFFAPLDDFYGLSPIQVAARVIDGDNAAVVWNQQLLSNDGRPSGALIVKGGLQDDARERAKEELELKISGARNARRPMVLEGDVDWKQFSLAPADLDWLEGRKQNRREIARVYNVPPELIGDTDVQGYASKEQARKSLYEETCLPLLDRRRDNLNNSVTPQFSDGLYLDYDRDQIEALHDDVQKMYQGLRQADWLSGNEKRAATGYDAYDGDPETDKPGDVPVMFLKPGALPGAPEDTLAPVAGTAPGSAPGDGAPASGTKAQQLSARQRKAEAALEKKLNAHFRSEAKALALHLKRELSR